MDKRRKIGVEHVTGTIETFQESMDTAIKEIQSEDLPIIDIQYSMCPCDEQNNVIYSALITFVSNGFW